MGAEDAGGDAKRERTQHRARPDALALTEPDGEPEGDEDIGRPNDRVGGDRLEQRQIDEGQHGRPSREAPGVRVPRTSIGDGTRAPGSEVH